MQVNAAAVGPAGWTFLIAFLAVLALGPSTIARLYALKFGQNINEDAPERHRQKQGTPTMGGVLLILGVVIALAVGLLIGPAEDRRLRAPLAAVVLVFLAHSLLGFADDFMKTRRGKSLGLKARQKLAGQFAIALVFAGWLALTAAPGQTTVVALGRGMLVDLGYVYYGLVVLLMVGLSNAANLTDGLDGLAGGLALLCVLGLAWTVDIYQFGGRQLPLFGYALAGACLGFLWFNAHPARVFMGDTGSLAIGAALAALGIVGKQEVLLLLFALVFLLETLSVMIQVSVFRMTGGKPHGRRVFRMTPLHHHFELLGWAETQVVARFWIIGALALALGLLLAPALSPFAPH